MNTKGIRTSLLGKGLLCGAVLFGFGAQAETLFTFNDFSNTTGLTFVGSATTPTTSDGTVLRLTPASSNASSAVYSTSALQLGSGDTFSTQFQFRFTNPGGIDPADGITFVLAASPTGLGGVGVGMGYQGVGHSVAIEFDTYNNAGYGIGDNDGNSSNHVSIDENGVLNNLALTNVYGNGSCGFANGSPAQNSNTAPGCMSNGQLWTATITFNGSQISVNLKDASEADSFTALSDYPIDIASLLGTSTAYVGFTSGTGAGWEDHDILNWTFTNDATLPSPPASDAPEPASLLLMSGGFAAVAGFGYRARRKASH